MVRIKLAVSLFAMFFAVLIAPLLGQDTEDPADKKAQDKTSASRLRAVREVMSLIKMEDVSVAGRGEALPLELKPDPILRYNDVTRGIADSVVFSVGKKGRPVALISAELYGREGKFFLLNHEFVALNAPHLKMERDSFVWEPLTGSVKFEEIKDAEKPAENARLRLAQMRRLAERFTASQKVGASDIVLRRMTTPVDRYEPSEKPKADGAIFAYAWGVNPEAALLIETDGEKWSYGWAPLSSAALTAKLGEKVVWECSNPPHETRDAPYTSIHRNFEVPTYFDDPDEEAKPAVK